MRITRREWAGALTAGAVRAAARAQDTPEELRQVVRENLRRAVAAIAKTPLPMAVEPAFLFKAQ